jgi:hypothetical protein
LKFAVAPLLEQFGNLRVLFHHQAEVSIADVEEVERKADTQTRGAK